MNSFQCRFNCWMASKTVQWKQGATVGEIRFFAHPCGRENVPILRPSWCRVEDIKYKKILRGSPRYPRSLSGMKNGFKDRDTAPTWHKEASIQQDCKIFFSFQERRRLAVSQMRESPQRRRWPPPEESKTERIGDGRSVLAEVSFHWKQKKYVRRCKDNEKIRGSRWLDFLAATDKLGRWYQN